MMHYDNGTREAEFLTRSSPDRVDYWLRKARADRQRWIIRLFRPALRQFLDGFIAGLEACAKQPKPEVLVAPLRIEPIASPRATSEAITRDVLVAPVAQPIPERDVPRPVETPPPPPPEAPPAPAQIPPAAVVEVRPAPLPEPEQPPVPSAMHTDFAGAVGHPDGDHAIGVFRLSSWSPRTRPQESASAVAVQPPFEPVSPPAQQPPEILWTNTLEQARAVGVVDLSAYDTLEYLNELRDIFDRRESLRNGVVGPEDPRAR